jgi:tetratricopeptide (TPR) repeat protein
MKAFTAVFLLIALWSWTPLTLTAHPQQDVSLELSRAQSFYYGGKFQESLILLTELDKTIGNDAQKTNVLLIIKLYMGLAHAGLDQMDQAKSRFVEVCKLDAKYTLNPQDYPPKIIALYNEAKTSCAQAPATGNTGSNMSITQSTYTKGKGLYDQGQFADALKYFNVVLALDSAHEFAREYAALAQQRLDLLNQQGYMEWRTNFDAGQFDKAAATYTKIRADRQPNAAQIATQIESQYQKTFTALVDSWKAACATRELTKLDAIRNEATSIAPGLPLGRDAVDQMQPCPSAAAPVVASLNPPRPASPAKPPANPPQVIVVPPASPAAIVAPASRAAVAPPSPAGDQCVQQDPLLALARVKYRVEPQIDPGFQQYLVGAVMVSIEIDEQGNVQVDEVAKAHPRIATAVKSAIEQWKFIPTVMDNVARCVQTDITITLRRR